MIAANIKPNAFEHRVGLGGLQTEAVNNVRHLRLVGRELGYQQEMLQLAADEIAKPETFDMLQQLHEHEPGTLDHVMRVTLFAAKLLEVAGGELDLTDEDKHSVVKTGLLHDMGKLNVPSKVLISPTGMTDEEFAQMRAHTFRGYEILLASEAHHSDGLLLGLTLLHHQVQPHRYIDTDDFTSLIHGYDPEKFKDILVLFAMADHLEAMTSDRPYVVAKNMTKQDIVKALREDLEFFDPSKAHLADAIAEEPYFWDKQSQSTDLDNLKHAFSQAAIASKPPIGNVHYLGNRAMTA